MSQINVSLPDGSIKVLEQGATVADAAASIGAGLARAALAGKVNGVLVDLLAPVSEGDAIEIVTAKSPEALGILRHSAAHVMAQAVKALFPAAQFAIGPAIEDGFYYDFEIGRSFTPEDLDAIEDKMTELIAADEPFSYKVVSKAEALAALPGQPFKAELIAELPDDARITLYGNGDFIDLCRGPHLPSTGRIPAVKLMKQAGAYWRGDSERAMLQRVYGTAWFSAGDLDAYLTRITEAEKRDHRKLGRELGIYTMDERAGVGLPMYLPNGARVIRIMQEWLRKELYRRGYEEVITPHIYKADVWKTSGHYGYYHDNMYFFSIDESEEHDGSRLVEYGVKPMNCPGHVMLYQANLHSYRELPVRYFEFGTVYRHEMSGVVHGLMRARGFTQDDAHVFCREDQVGDEILQILDLADKIMKEFGFEYSAEISTRPEKSIGTDDMWEKAESFLRTAIEQRGIPYDINEGDGAFYGPKIDIKVKDAIGRMWQCSTIQVDFNLPERFDMTYRTADNTEARPWMLHRAIFGSIERFLGILLEHYAGALPLWLAPIQAKIIPIADRHIEAARKTAAVLQAVGGRVTIATENEPMRVKIAKAQQQKIPYMLVIGDRESEGNMVSVRERSEGDQGAMTVDDFAAILAAAQV
jgi:threonyl-tRNA synthetase